jgi:hypothetical protein
VDKTITLDANGLSYTGWCDDPAWGGGHKIGSRTVHEFLELMAVVADPGRFLARVDTHLDSVPITPGRPLTPGDEVVFFAGSIGLGDHVVGASFSTRGAAPNIAYSTDEAFTVAAGGRLPMVFTVAGRTATAVMRRSSDL